MATLKRIRDSLDTTLKPTPKGVGLTWTPKVTTYDSGLIEVDGVPMEGGWGDVAEVLLATMNEVRRQAEKRRAR